MRTLAYHEAIPGHHFQLALQVENKALPRFRQSRVFGGFAAFSEGWGLHAERLASDLGWYQGDPVSDLGRLNAELFRARRLVTDTGLHTKGWTREQAIAYGIPRSEVAPQRSGPLRRHARPSLLLQNRPIEDGG